MAELSSFGLAVALLMLAAAVGSFMAWLMLRIGIRQDDDGKD